MTYKNYFFLFYKFCDFFQHVFELNYNDHDMTYNVLKVLDIPNNVVLRCLFCAQRRCTQTADYPLQMYLVTVQFYAILIFDLYIF